LKNGVINSGEVASSGRLVFFRAKSEGVDVDTSGRMSGVVLERLDNVEVRTFTFRESVLTVKLKLGGDNRVFSPAVHVKGSFRKNECSGIRGSGSSTDGGIEKTRGINYTGKTGVGSEGVDGVRKSINGISVVERLSTKSLVKKRVSQKRGTVVDVGVRLDDPDEFFARVVEVKLDLVGRRSNRFITCELKLFKEVFMRVLGHLSTFIGIKEDVINVKGGGNEGLLVSLGDGLLSGSGSKRAYGPETFTNRSQVKVDLDFVVLKSNKRKGKSRVAAVPELEWNIKSGLRKSVTRSGYLTRSV